MYFAGRSPGHSPFGQWPFSPWSIGCSVQDQNFALQVPLVPAFRSRVRPSVWSVLDTIGQQSLHLFTSDGSPGLLSSSLFLLASNSKAARPPTKERESTEHLSHWREFRPHPIFNCCSPNTKRNIFFFVLGEQQPLCHKSDL
jgi:hypothetical protein